MYMFDALWEHVVHTLRSLEDMGQSPFHPFKQLRDYTEQRMKSVASVQKNFLHVVVLFERGRVILL